MKAILLTLLISSPVWAATLDTVNEKSFDVEAEEMDVYDHAALEKAAKDETNQMTRETKVMDQKVAGLKREGERLKQNTKTQSDRFAQSKKLSAEVGRKLSLEQREKDHAQKNLETAQYRLKQSQDQLADRKNQVAQTRSQLIELNQQKTSALNRIHRAEQQIATAERQLERLKSQKQNLKKNVVELNRRAEVSEGRAQKAQTRLASLR